MMVCKHMVVMLFAGLVVQCTAMSLSELEDFANFLKKTSQLDETLKKGTDTVDYDEDEAVSDNAWEESGKFEGDLILNERQRRMIVEDIAEGLSRNGLRDSTKRWPDNEVIYYIQKEHFSSDQAQAIRDGIDDLARASCVKFRPYRKGDRDAVVIQGSRRGCFSQVGYQGGYQVLNLSGRHPVGRGCFRHGTVVHELLHSLGFYHMQSSPDRDDYVDIKWENIVQPARHNFRKYNAFSVSDFGVGYDYDSVLHYSRRAFSSNGQDTIVPKQGGANIGQRTGLSDKDAQKLNKMYCDADNSNDENDSPTHKTPVKKKTPKNKPFEGHGIGYHQGKTVVIKLSPAAETYHIVNKPAFPMFNYFSKASQVLSPKETEGFGPGTRVANKPYTYNEDVIAFKPLVSNINSKPTNNEKSLPNNDVDSKVIKHENTNKSPENKDEDLDDAFKRLAKILKTHVYPKHLPDLKVFKVNTDYSEFGDPQKLPKIAYSFVPTLTIQRDDKLYPNEHIKSLNGNGPESLKSEKLDPSKLQKYIDNYSKLFQETHVNEDHTEDSTHREESESEKHKLMVEKLRNPKNMFEIVETVKEHGVPLDADAKYRTTYPFILKHENSSGSFSIELQTPDYALHDNLKDKHNFSNLYRPYLRDEDDSGNIKYTLFGESVPTYDDWYQRDDHRRNPIDYSRQSYTDSGPYSNNLIHHYDTTDSSEQEPDDTKYTTSFSPQTKQAYTLYGAPVPLTEDWYKVNRKQIIGDYPHTFYRNNEYSESSEDDSKEK